MPRPIGTGPDPELRNLVSLDAQQIELTLPRPGDVDDLFALIHRNPEVTAGLMWDGPENRRDFAMFFNRYAEYRFVPDGHHWVIRDKGDVSGHPGSPLGAIGIRPGALPGRSDIGYWLGQPYWGQGVMTEAVTAVVNHGFTELNMNRIEAGVFLTNPASSAVLAKAGFHVESIQRSSLYKSGTWIDAELWVILRSDWQRSD